MTGIPTPLIVAALLVALACGIAGFLLWRKAQAATAAREHGERIRRRKEREQKSKEKAATVSGEIALVRQSRKMGERRPIIIVAEDSKTAQKELERILMGLPYKVFFVADGREAWACMQDYTPDLLLTDIDMPYINGLDLVDMVRSDMKLAEVPIILMTGDADALVKARRLSGLSGLLVKPLNARDVVSQIHFVIQDSD